MIQLSKAPQQNFQRLPHAPTILLVEDEEFIRTIVGMSLRCQGYNVIEASSAAEAARLWYENADAIGLALIDLRLGEGEPTGWEVAQRFQKINRSLKVILTTGRSIDDLPTDQPFHMLQKPYNTAQLSDAVRHALNDAS